MKVVREVWWSVRLRSAMRGGLKRYNAVLRKAVDAALCGSAVRGGGQQAAALRKAVGSATVQCCV